MKYIISFTLLTLLSSFSYKGNQKTIFSTNKVSIEATVKNCNDTKNGINKEYVFLNFSNKTSSDIEITYYTELFYNGTCYSCTNKEEYTFTVSIPANGSLEGSCSNKSQKVAIFSKMLDGVKASELTSYSVKNVVVK